MKSSYLSTLFREVRDSTERTARYEKGQRILTDSSSRDDIPVSLEVNGKVREKVENMES